MPRSTVPFISSLTQYETNQDAILNVGSWVCLLSSEMIKSGNPTSTLGEGLTEIFLKIDGARWVLRFFGHAGAIERLVLKTHLGEETKPLRTLGLIQNILWFSYHPLERLAWVQMVAPKMVSYDGAFYGRVSTWCWLLSMFIDVYRCFLGLKKLNKKRASMKPEEYNQEKKKILVSILKRVLWMPLAYGWTQSEPMWDGKQTGLLGTVAGGFDLFVNYFKVQQYLPY